MRALPASRSVTALVVALVASLPALVPAGGAAAGPGAASLRAAVPVEVGCDEATTVLEVAGDVVLDPACTYTGGIEVHTSGTTLDCRGARIADDGTSPARRGILISAPVTEALHDVTVRNCHVEGFLNNLRVTRDGFRDLPEGEEYEHAFADIVIEDSTFRGSRGVGIFVDGYVTGVTIRDSLVTGTGSSGIYLETGSVGTEVVGNDLVDNGYRENGPGGQSFSLGGLSVWWWGVGREAIAIDGARSNHVHGNRISGSSAGAIQLYKNCGEYPDRPAYFERRYGSHDNVIEDNHIEDEVNGVWVGSRMGENTLPMDCTDPAYVDEPLRRVVLDQARRNVVRGNTFVDVTYGVRVEDDETVVAGNRFEAGTPDHHAVLVGTPDRTEVLGLPVTGTVLEGNVSEIAGNATPYRWQHGHEGTTARRNAALGQRVALCEGPPPPRSPMVFVVELVAWDPSTPPPPPPDDVALPTLGALPTCPGAVLGPVDPGFADVGADHRFAWEIGALVLAGIAEGYDDGTFRPTAPVSRQAMVAFLHRALAGDGAGGPVEAVPAPPCDEPPFADVPVGHRFCGEIAWAADAGLVEGDDDGRFRPDAPVSRQAAAAVLHRALAVGTDVPCTEAPFPDVPADHRFCTEIAWMVGAGLADGYDDGTFRPTAPVSRQAAAAFVDRAFLDG